MKNKQQNIIQQLRNTVTNLSLSFNTKRKHNKNQKNIDNHQNKQKNSNSHNYIAATDDIIHSPITDNIEKQGVEDDTFNYLDIIHDYKQLIFASHNIQGGFKNKKDSIKHH